MPTTKPTSISELVRELRQQLNLSRERFAIFLGVSFKTVNRWKNGHRTPSSMALKLIKHQLLRMGVPGKALLNESFPEMELGDDV